MLITNAKLITWGKDNQIIESGALYIEGDKIVELGPSPELQAKYPAADILDARGQLVMPGNICAHTHFYSAFARGMAIPGEAPRDFPEILAQLWWKLDKSLTMEDVRYSALVSLVDAVKHGTTTLIDHHASPNALDGSLDVIAEAVQQTGLRAVLCYEVSDRDGPEKAQAGIAENVRFMRRTQNGDFGGQVAATFGLHASLTLSVKTHRNTIVTRGTSDPATASNKHPHGMRQSPLCSGDYPNGPATAQPAGSWSKRHTPVAFSKGQELPLPHT